MGWQSGKAVFLSMCLGQVLAWNSTPGSSHLYDLTTVNYLTSYHIYYSVLKTDQWRQPHLLSILILACKRPDKLFYILVYSCIMLKEENTGFIFFTVEASGLNFTSPKVVVIFSPEISVLS